ncbi:hypothetical protein [Marinomonas sp. 2405UD68-3]|uniref:hypothetical protein n=1 Tax=Marinomonas sp. 2405UD68-3 TaxID=3391835 RepID=UPI0039C91F66
MNDSSDLFLDISKGQLRFSNHEEGNKLLSAENKLDMIKTIRASHFHPEHWINIDLGIELKNALHETLPPKCNQDIEDILKNGSTSSNSFIKNLDAATLLADFLTKLEDNHIDIIKSLNEANELGPSYNINKYVEICNRNSKSLEATLNNINPSLSEQYENISELKVSPPTHYLKLINQQNNEVFEDFLHNRKIKEIVEKTSTLELSTINPQILGLSHTDKEIYNNPITSSKIKAAFTTSLGEGINHLPIPKVEKLKLLEAMAPIALDAHSNKPSTKNHLDIFSREMQSLHSITSKDQMEQIQSFLGKQIPKSDQNEDAIFYIKNPNHKDTILKVSMSQTQRKT